MNPYLAVIVSKGAARLSDGQDNCPNRKRKFMPQQRFLHLLTSIGGRSPAVRLRPLHVHDTAVLETVFAALSARSRHLRFHTPTPRLTGALRRGLLDVDGRRRCGLVAEVATAAGRVPVGIAHLVGVDRHNADFAVAVVDSWHGHGVGRALMDGLRELAIDLGFQTMHGDILAENRAMLRLALATLPGLRTATEGHVIRVSHDLDDARCAGEDVLADLAG